ncbi:MAG: hypothetical protein AB7T32_05995 [Dehalococcoidia bacterium]
MSVRLTAIVLSTVVLLGLLTLACEDTSEVSGPNSVRLSEWKVEAGASELAAGAVKLQVQNVGTQAHDIFVIRTDLAAEKLPVKSGTVDLNGLEVAGSKKDIERREKVSLDLELKPGAYVLICNISGHYTLGMHTGLVVK